MIPAVRSKCREESRRPAVAEVAETFGDISLAPPASGPVSVVPGSLALSPLMLNLVLAHQHGTRVRDLSGFRRSHRIPEEDSDRARDFVAKIAADEINRDLDERFSDFRRVLGLKRTQMQVSDADAGAGFIRTPEFTYQVSIALDPDEASQALWRRQVAEFLDPQPLLSDEFHRVFGTLFDTVEFEPPEPVDLEDFIDHIEDRPSDDLSVDYDRSATWCRVSALSHHAEMTVYQDRVSVRSLQPGSPSVLLQSFFAVRDSLPGIAWLHPESTS